MQIMSIIRRFVLIVGVSVAISAIAASGSELLQFSLPDTRTISIGHVGSKLVAREIRQKTPPISFDAQVQSHLANAESATHIFPTAISKTSPPLFVVVIRKPSTVRRGMGFCGAGLEDYLLLLEVGNNKIVLKDELLLQSCLKSIALASDSGDDPIKALQANPATQEIFFQTLGQEAGEKVTVESGKFRLASTPVQ
jgi:hypothetical protein